MTGRPMARTLLLALICAFGAISCRSAYEYQPPVETGDGWQTASLRDVGLDERLLSRAIDRIRRDEYQNVHSLLIVVDGKLVLEEYFAGYRFLYDREQYKGQRVAYDRDTIHNLASVTKAVTSALVGIAIDRGDIESVNAGVYAFFPEYAHLGSGVKDRITLQHLLTMSSGLEWNEGQYSYGDPRNDLIRLFSIRDPVAYMLSRPVRYAPGTTYYYSGADVNLLGEIIKRATGQRMDAFAAETLFAPLGITRYEWDFINRDVVHASGNLQLRPRDVAKFGYLYWSGGVWQGQQVIPEAWVTESKRAHVPIPDSRNRDTYGYQWRQTTYRVDSTPVQAFGKGGWGGQQVTVLPDLDMVVVFTGGNYASPNPVREITERYIVPAAR